MMHANSSIKETIARMESLVRRDPAHRGLLSSPDIDDLFPQGQLLLAAENLAKHAHSLWIVTGFYIPGATPPAAESDGPLGALLLASVLRDLGRRVELLTDPRCYPLVRETALLTDFPLESVRECSEDHIDSLESQPPPDLTHLIAVERVGPSHTKDSFLAQLRSGEPPLEDFERKVPSTARDHCHNMRGEVIDSFTGTLHRLFDFLPQANPQLRTIGIGDGGNEIGMGKIPWEMLAARLPDLTPAKSICRIPTDWNILAGTSNWGAYALAAAVALLENRLDLLQRFTADQQLRLLEALLEKQLVVDGVTRQFQPTVDGLPFLTYIQPWISIRKQLNLDDPLS